MLRLVTSQELNAHTEISIDISMLDVTYMPHVNTGKDGPEIYVRVLV